MGRALAVLGLLAGLGYVAGVRQDILWLRLLAKPVPVLCLAAWVGPSAGRYARLIAAGLLLSVVGDVFMELGQFLPGVTAFAAAHVCYIAAFVVDARRLRPLLALPVAAWGAGTYLFLRPGLGAMAVPVAVYVTIICAMMWRAAARLGEGGGYRVDQWAGAVGAGVFAASDTLIALDRFHAPIAWARYAIILLYWSGQWGIARSAHRG